MLTNKRFWIATLVIIAAALLATATPAQASPLADQETCTALSEQYENIAHPEDPAWVSCFVQGWVNWVFGTENGQPLPNDPPQAVKDALQHGLFVQLTEPWNATCDNTLQHPDCSIGYLDLFSDWDDLLAFLAVGKFEQAGIMKDGPWSIGSLWMAEDFVQVSRGDTMPDVQMNLFCNGSLGLAFAFDGEYPLPSATPCGGDGNVYYLWESWRGGCIGDEVTDVNCNVSQLLVYEDWSAMLSYLSDNSWTRGAVFANSEQLSAVDTVVSDTNSTGNDLAVVPPAVVEDENSTDESVDEADTSVDEQNSQTDETAADATPLLGISGDQWIGILLVLAALITVLVINYRRRNKVEQPAPTQQPPAGTTT
jgi:hypothetical protein